MADFTGKTFGVYTLTELLGRGGMAAVYRGYQEAIDRSVAIKIMPSDWLTDPNFLKRFMQEAKVLAKLTHPAILPLYEFGEANSVPYIVMPLMSGGSLADYLKKTGALSLDETIKILTPIADALDFAHSQGILHRDLKPNNILFDQRQAPYLADFGIAKSMEGGTNITGTGIIGTPDYMSPEQARGDVLDHRSDLYSLGVMAYQMLTGDVLFHATTPMGVIFKHVTDTPPMPRQLRPDLPEGVDDVLAKILAKDPNERYQKAQDFVRSLAQSAGMTVSQFEITSAVTHPTPNTVTPAPDVQSAPPIMPQTMPQTVRPIGAQTPPAGFTPPPIAEAPPATYSPPVAETKSRFGSGMVAGIAATIVGLCLFCGLCTTVVAIMAPTPTPTGGLIFEETPTPDDFFEATPTEEFFLADVTPTPEDEATPEGVDEVSLADDFSSDSGLWPTGLSEEPFATSLAMIEDGQYRWEVKNSGEKGVFWYTVPDMGQAGDFYASVDVRQVTGPADSDYGLVFRFGDGANMYYFGISPAVQKYALMAKKDGEWETLLDWTQSDNINSNNNDVNTLSVQAKGPSLILLINGFNVGAITDDRLERGQVGIAVQLYHPSDEMTLEFDNFNVQPPLR